MAEYLGMERGPQIDLGRHLTEVLVARKRTRIVQADYDQLLAEYEKLAARFAVEVEGRRLDQAALAARRDQITYICEKGLETADQDTSHKFKDGTPKKASRIVFEEALKKYAAKMKIPTARVLKYLDV